MEIRKTLKPGQHGTLKYVQQYGESLVCIRYRYDADQNVYYTTAELIVKKRPCLKNFKNHSTTLPDKKLIIGQSISDHDDTFLSIRVAYEELLTWRINISKRSKEML